MTDETDGPERAVFSSARWTSTARVKATAHQAAITAGMLVLYALLALAGSLAQANKIGHLALQHYPDRTVTWLAWWVLSGVSAVILASACAVVATLLGLQDASQEKRDGVDDYR